MFTNRSTLTELLDADCIPQQDLFRNLHELDVINRLLGGHAVTLKAFKSLNLKQDKVYHVLDIGSGGGDTLKAIAKWGRKNGIQLALTGVDLKSDCIQYAQSFCKEYPEIKFIQSDYRQIPNLQLTFDIIISALFCHHLSDDEIQDLCLWGSKNANNAFIINDLHRHPLAYYSIACITQIFSKSYLVKNDAKLSVLRGFKKRDLTKLIKFLTTQKITLKWMWAFRWLLVIRK
jgi:2-polyprenyl-3-methyl-5-hydroxy-6-metoxy-1,4-benzoquinol methylase